MSPVIETPVQKQKCIEPECKKAPNGFKTNVGLKRHMKKFHEVVLGALSPMTLTARTLFAVQDVPETPSVQGNSHGQINLPSVLTEGRFLCGKCEEQFSSRDEVMKHMDSNHDEGSIPEHNDDSENDDHGNEEEQDNINNDTNEEQELTEVMEDLDDDLIATSIEKRVAAEKIVDTFVEMAYREMHSSESTPKIDCHECRCKDENAVKLDKLMNEKDAIIEEKAATIRGLMETMRKNTKTRTAMQKKVNHTDKVKRLLVAKQKEVANLKSQMQTRIQLAEVQADVPQPEGTNRAPKEIIVDAIVKRCKKCSFTAPNMDVLGLHMENDHQYEFQCAECSKKFPFKNQLKMHRREVHAEGTFACFVCDNKFRAHKDLKLHIQKQCKSNALPKPIIHKHNEDIMKEDEHKCPVCPKITNNQVSLVNHINTTHGASKEKCDSCGKEFQSRETLIEHIVDKHTVNGTHVIQRHVCKVCNVEVHGDVAKNNHICRNHQDTCSFCKVKLYSQEAKN